MKWHVLAQQGSNLLFLFRCVLVVTSRCVVCVWARRCNWGCSVCLSAEVGTVGNLIGEIVKVDDRERSYLVKTETGRLYWRNRRFLRKYIPTIEAESPDSSKTTQGPIKEKPRDNKTMKNSLGSTTDVAAPRTSRSSGRATSKPRKARRVRPGWMYRTNIR